MQDYNNVLFYFILFFFQTRVMMQGTSEVVTNQRREAGSPQDLRLTSFRRWFLPSSSTVWPRLIWFLYLLSVVRCYPQLRMELSTSSTSLRVPPITPNKAPPKTCNLLLGFSRNLHSFELLHHRSFSTFVLKIKQRPNSIRIRVWIFIIIREFFSAY